MSVQQLLVDTCILSCCSNNNDHSKFPITKVCHRSIMCSNADSELYSFRVGCAQCSWHLLMLHPSSFFLTLYVILPSSSSSLFLFSLRCLTPLAIPVNVTAIATVTVAVPIPISDLRACSDNEHKLVASVIAVFILATVFAAHQSYWIQQLLILFVGSQAFYVFALTVAFVSTRFFKLERASFDADLGSSGSDYVSTPAAAAGHDQKCAPHTVSQRVTSRKTKDTATVKAKSSSPSSNSVWDVFYYQRSTASLPFITVIVPSRNESVVLQQLVEWFTKIRYPSELMKLVIVDDCSYDDTPRLLEALCVKYPWLCTVRRKRSGGGKSGSMNAGYTSIDPRTDIVGYLDADCRMDPYILLRVVRTFEQGRHTGAVQVGKCIAPDMCLNSLTQFQFWEFLGDGTLHQARYCAGGQPDLHGNGQFVRMPVLKASGGACAWNAQSVSDDLDFSARLCLAGVRIALCDCIAVVYEEPVYSWKSVAVQRKRWTTGGYQRFIDYWRTWLDQLCNPSRKFAELPNCWNNAKQSSTFTELRKQCPIPSVHTPHLSNPWFTNFESVMWCLFVYISPACVVVDLLASIVLGSEFLLGGALAAMILSVIGFYIPVYILALDISTTPQSLVSAVVSISFDMLCYTVAALTVFRLPFGTRNMPYVQAERLAKLQQMRQRDDFLTKSQQQVYSMLEFTIVAFITCALLFEIVTAPLQWFV
jgi:cellulose synthase/poly-beta-1,6-N-acetylglucosamine synthase-like glycosyltransferase